VRVIATLTIDGIKEIRIEGDSTFLGGAPGDVLEEKGLGFWLSKYRIGSQRGRVPRSRSRVFLPWTSVLYTEEVMNAAR
jgi:hypothetical protein